MESTVQSEKVTQKTTEVNVKDFSVPYTYTQRMIKHRSGYRAERNNEKEKFLAHQRHYYRDARHVYM